MSATATDYRLRPDEIRADRCQARRFTDADKDSRWSPAVYRERQCEKSPTSTSDLCAQCQRNLESHRLFGLRKDSAWKGRITEEPLGDQHMLGTDWAGRRTLVWVGGDAPAWWRPAPAPLALNVAEPAPAPLALNVAEVAPAPAPVSDAARIAALERQVALLTDAVTMLLGMKSEAEHTAVTRAATTAERFPLPAGSNAYIPPTHVSFAAPLGDGTTDRAVWMAAFEELQTNTAKTDTLLAALRPTA